MSSMPHQIDAPSFVGARPDPASPAAASILIRGGVAMMLAAAGLAAVGFVAVSDRGRGRAQIEHARVEARALDAMVYQYTLTHRAHDLPQDLRALTEGEAPITAEIPVDPWGNLYVYQRAEDGASWEVFSAGPDGRVQTADDIHPDRLWEATR